MKRVGPLLLLTTRFRTRRKYPPFENNQTGSESTNRPVFPLGEPFRRVARPSHGLPLISSNQQTSAGAA